MAHNGGRSQLNLNFLTLGGDYAFMNILKCADKWSYIDAFGPSYPSDFNSTGYPTTIQHSGVKTTFTIPSTANRSGNYRVKWTGGGSGATIYNPSHTLQTGSKTGNSGQFTFAAGSQTVTLGISASDGTLSDLSVVHENDTALYDGGQVFGVKFLEILNYLRPGTIRFMDWLESNTNTASVWAHRRPIDYVFYGGDEQRANLYGGITTNSGDDYSLAYAPATSPVQGTTVICTFNSTCTGTAPTLNGYALKDYAGNAVSSGNNTKPLAGYTGILFFDASLNCWVKQGGDTGSGVTGTNYLKNGVPIEQCVALCNAIGAHAWFTLPRLSVDPLTDYCQSLAQYCKDNLSSGLKFKLEGTNETWNSSAGFTATPWGNTKATARWGTGVTGYHDWYGMQMSKAGRAVYDVFAGDTNRYEVICAIQAASAGQAATNPRLASTLYVAEGGGNVAASTYVTHTSHAHYHGYTATNTNELAYAYEYSLGGTSAARKLELTGYAVATTRAYFSGTIVPRIQACLTWGASYGVTKWHAYEGGWEPGIITTVDTTAVVTAITKAASAVVTISGTTFPPVGSTVSFASVAGMTEINGGSGVVSSYSTGANTVTVAINSSTYSTYTSGGVMTFVNSSTNISEYRRGCKADPAIVAEEQFIYQTIRYLGGNLSEPSCFMLAGSSAGASGQIWGIYDPDIYTAMASPEAIHNFNTTTRPYRMTVTT